MSDRIRSGIFFHGSRMRYAEIQHARAGLRLLRLGSCDFDFDAEHATLTGEARKLETIREAVADVFSGSRSSDFSVVLSPGSVISFFSPVSDRMPEDAKKRQLEAETVLIGGDEASLRVVAEPVMSEIDDGDGALTWYHVAAIPAQVRQHVSTFLSGFSEVQHHVITSMQACSRVVGRLEEGRLGSAEKTAAAVVGCFIDFTEVAILDDAKWRFGSRTRSGLPSDIAYALLNTIKQAQVAADRVGRVYVYGDSMDDSSLSALKNASSSEVLALDPLGVVQNDPVDVRPSFDPAQYVLCVGAAI